jgi:hypothetical protein
MDFAALQRKIEVLNEKLRPIADRPIEFGRDMLERVAALPNPLDEAGVRDEAESTLLSAVALYERVSVEERQKIRDLFKKKSAFAWAATLPFPPDSAARFRQHLIHFSIIDQGTDARDAVLWLQDLCRRWHDDAIRREVAEMSSDVNHYGFGSTRKMISGR